MAFRQGVQKLLGGNRAAEEKKIQRNQGLERLPDMLLYNTLKHQN